MASNHDALCDSHWQSKALHSRDGACLEDKRPVGATLGKLAVDASRLGASASRVRGQILEDIVVLLGFGEITRIDLSRNGRGASGEGGEGSRDSDVGRSRRLNGDSSCESCRRRGRCCRGWGRRQG